MSETWSWHTEETFPSETNAGKRFLDEVLAQLERHEYSPKEIFGVHMAVEEALVNAIKHGNGLDARKKVRVTCQLSKDRLRIEIQDEGTGFDPNHVPDPTAPENIELPCGRGLMLMRSFMSKVEYNKAGNCVVMEKQRTG